MIETIVYKIKRHAPTILIILLIITGIFYIYLSTLPKNGNFNEINFDSNAFAVYGTSFIDKIVPKYVDTIEYPPTYFVLQGYWIKLGSYLFNYDLNAWAESRNYLPYHYYLWGMVPNLICLFVFVAISYFTLKNKWLSLICFGTLTFVSVIIMGQIDIFSALFVYISMVLMLKASDSEKYLYLLFFGVISLGISTQFKTYGGILLPLYLIYGYTILKSKNIPDMRAYGTIAAMAFAFIISFFIAWIPFAKWFGPTILSGQSNWLFNLQISPLNLPPYHIILIWLFGYAIIVYYSLHNALKADRAYDNKKYFIFYSFAIIAWFFATVLTYSQWWVLLLPAILLVLDNFKNKLNYIFCLALMTLFPFYSMMWGGITNILVHYMPVVHIYGQTAAILTTTIFALLIIWTLEIKAELEKPAPTEASLHQKMSRSPIDSIVPFLMLVVPFLVIFLIVPPYILSVGAVGTKITAYDMASEPLHGNITVGQSFVSPRDDLEGIGIRFTYNMTPTVSYSRGLILHLKTDISSPDIATVIISPRQLSDEEYTRFTFPAIANSKNKRYYFVVEAPNSPPDKTVSVLYESSDDYSAGTAYMNGSPIHGDLAFETIHKSRLSDIMGIYY